MSNIAIFDNDFLARHPKLGATVVIKKPGWFKRLMGWPSDQDKTIGKEGCVFGVSRGVHGNKLFYSVIFIAERGNKQEMMGVYSAEDLEFKSKGIFEK